MTITSPTRSDVLVEQTWRLNNIFSTPADWDTACRHLACVRGANPL
jgi:hypothetical protein